MHESHFSNCQEARTQEKQQRRAGCWGGHQTLPSLRHAHFPADGEIPDFIAPALYTLCVLTGNAQRIQCGFCRSRSRHRRLVGFVLHRISRARGVHTCKGEDMHASIHAYICLCSRPPGRSQASWRLTFLSLVGWPDAFNHVWLSCLQSCILLGVLLFVDIFGCLTLRTSVLIWGLMVLPSMGAVSAQQEGSSTLGHHRLGLSK